MILHADGDALVLMQTLAEVVGRQMDVNPLLQSYKTVLEQGFGQEEGASSSGVSSSSCSHSCSCGGSGRSSSMGEDATGGLPTGGVPVVPSTAVEGIIGRACENDPRERPDTGLDDDLAPPPAGAMGAAVEVPGLEEQEDLRGGNKRYYAGEAQLREGAVQRLDCDIQGNLVTPQGQPKLTVESGLFAVLFERGMAFNAGAMFLADYMCQRVEQLWSPFTLMKEYVLVMFQVRNLSCEAAPRNGLFSLPSGHPFHRLVIYIPETRITVTPRRPDQGSG